MKLVNCFMEAQCFSVEIRLFSAETNAFFCVEQTPSSSAVRSDYDVGVWTHLNLVNEITSNTLSLSKLVFLRRTAVFLRTTEKPCASMEQFTSCRRVSFSIGEPALDREGRYLNAAAMRFHGTCLFLHGTCETFHGKSSHSYGEARFLRRKIWIVLKSLCLDRSQIRSQFTFKFSHSARF